MITNNTLGANVFIRITTLWAGIEAFLGGILHAAHFPFSGLALSLLASICMSVLATNGYTRGQILKATLIVIAIKFFMAPHTPSMAYLAVLVEGLFGEFIFMLKRFKKVAAFILSLFCVTYSAFQKLIILTITYSNTFWENLNTFMNQVAKSLHQQSNIEYVSIIVLIYVGIHIIGGIIGGWLNVSIIHNYQHNKQPVLSMVDVEAYTNKEPQTNGKKRKKYVYLWPIMILLVILVLSYTPYFKTIIAQKTIIMLLLRAVVIFLLWKYVLVNLLQKVLHVWVQRFQKNNAGQMQMVLQLLPTAKQVIQYSWHSSATVNKWVQLKQFVHKIVQWVLYAP
jgi:hypothetical protein